MESECKCCESNKRCGNCNHLTNETASDRGFGGPDCGDYFICDIADAFTMRERRACKRYEPKKFKIDEKVWFYIPGKNVIGNGKIIRFFNDGVSVKVEGTSILTVFFFEFDEIFQTREDVINRSNKNAKT